MAPSFLPALFATGQQGRGISANLLNSALNRQQRGTQFRRQLREQRRAEERQRQAQKEAQQDAFTNQLITAGISTAAGAGAGAALGAGASGAAATTGLDAASKGVVDATAPALAEGATSGLEVIPDVATGADTNVAPTVAANVPTPLPVGGFDSPSLITQTNNALLSTPTDYSSASTNLPAANLNPGLTGITPQGKSSLPNGSPRLAGGPEFSTPGNPGASIVAGNSIVAPQPTTPRIERPVTLGPGPLRGPNAGTGALLGALGGLTGQNYLGTYLSSTALNPLRNAQFGLDLARNETLRGLDTARIATERARQGDIEADTARTRYLTPIEGYSELGAGAKNFADANQTNALTAPKAFKERTAGFANQQRGFKSQGDNRRAEELQPGALTNQRLEGNRLTSSADLNAARTNEVQTRNNIREDEAARGQPLQGQEYGDLLESVESRVKRNPDQVNAIFDDFLRTNGKRLSLTQIENLMNEWNEYYGYVPADRRGQGNSGLPPWVQQRG